MNRKNFLTRLMKRTKSNPRSAINRRRRLIVEYLEGRTLLAADTPPFVDINPIPYSSAPGAGGFVTVGDEIFFTAVTNTNGAELWKTNGTDQGTVMVKDINPGPSGSTTGAPISIGGVVFFSANDGTNGSELWKSDGTSGGTVLVKDIRSGGFSSNPQQLVNANGTLYFVADDGLNGAELWKSDGTATGTVLVKDIQTGLVGSSPIDLTAVGGVLYFGATDTINGLELWKSDGTPVGTVLVKDIRPGSLSSSLSELTEANGTLFFVANDGSNGNELWKSDGTSLGTVIVKDIKPGGYSASPNQLTNVNGVLFFAADAFPSENARELWKSDGSLSGTVQVKDIRPTGGSDPNLLINVNGSLFFNANDGATGVELWRSDGTNSGTVLVKDVRSGSSTSTPASLTNINGQLFFVANDGVNGLELWKSDGTFLGTNLVKDVFAGISNSSPRILGSIQGSLYFGANDGTNGDELWRTDGSVLGTTLVKNINAAAKGSYPWPMANANGTLYFRADNGVNGQELWKSDGTATGTVLIKDIRSSPAATGSDPQLITNVGGTVFFRADDGTGYELWKSDGTAIGTNLVKDIRSGAGSLPSNLTNVNGTLYFTAADGTNGSELWKSDGTSSGTVMVNDIRIGASGSSPSLLTNVNGTLFFVANDGSNGQELWKSDGTPLGTILVKDISGGPSSSSPTGLINVNGTLFFSASDGVNTSLWISDGTPSGTVVVKVNCFPTKLTNLNGTVYFYGYSSVNGSELWRSDGTPLGTFLVKDIYPGTNSSILSELTAVDGSLFFVAYDGVHGLELWRSDGTESGTVMVKDIIAGTADANLQYLTNVNGTLYFRANDGVNGLELWKSDGTPSGTILAADIASDSASSSPSRFAVIGNNLYFAATTDSFATELYKVTNLPSNSPPTNIELSSSSLAENSAANSVVGALSATDPNAGDTFTYSFVTGTGSIDNALFNLNGNQLRATSSLDFEASPTRSVRIRTTDQGGLFFEKTFVITVTNVNEAPTNVTLSNNTIVENAIAGSVVGNLAGVDPDAGDTVVVTLVSGALDNDSFAVVGNELRTALVCNYEVKTNYSVRLRATDASGLTFDKDFVIDVLPVNEFPPVFTSPATYIQPENQAAVGTLIATDADLPVPTITFTITGGADSSKFQITSGQLQFIAAPNFEAPIDANVDNVYLVQVTASDGQLTTPQNIEVTVLNLNEVPSDLQLSASTIVENAGANAAIGDLSSTDQDADSSFVYTLVTGTGSTNNSLFNISGNQLRATSSLDFEAAPTRSVRIRTTDQGGLFFEKAFVITVTNVNEVPFGIESDLSTNKDVALTFTLNAIDPENQPLTYVITQQPAHGLLSGTAPNLTYTPQTGFAGTDELFFTVSDGTYTSTETRVIIGVVGPKPTVSFSSSSTSVSESVGTLTVSAQLSFPMSQDLWFPISVDVSTNATLNSDYLAPSLSLKIAAGQLTGSMSVQIVNDTDYEPGTAETLVLAMSSGYAANLGSPSLYIISINDDDSVPSVAFTASGLTTYESGTVTARVRLSGASTQSITVPFSVHASSSATAGSDYDVIQPASGTLTFLAGETEKQITIPLIDDTFVESMEKIELNLGAPTNATLGQQTSYSLNILDNETPNVTLTQFARTLGEASGAFSVTAVLSNASSQQVTVPVDFYGNATVGTSVSVGVDVVVPSPAQFVFPAGQTTAVLNFSIVDDAVAEGYEQFEARLRSATDASYAIGSTSRSIVTIIDNDSQIVTFTTNDLEVWEDAGTISITAQLSSPAVTALTVPVMITQASGPYATPGSDFSISSSAFQFAIGQSSATRTVSIVNDNINETTESLRVAFTSPISTSYVLGSKRSVDIRIKDDDPLLSIVSGRSTVPESNTTVTHTLQLSAPTNRAVTIPFTTSGTATKGSDYSVTPNNGTATIAAYSTSGSIELTIVDDSAQEGNEQATVSILTPQNARLNPQVASSVSTTIVDNDMPVVGFKTKDFNINEAKVATFSFPRFRFNNRHQLVEVQMGSAANRDVFVTVAFGGTAKRGTDYKINGLTNDQVRIPAGSLAASFDLEILDDSLVEGNESLVMTLTGVSSAGQLPSSPPRITATIIDNDRAPSPPAPPRTPPATVGNSGQLQISPILGAFPISGSGIGSTGRPVPVGALAIGSGNQGGLDAATVYFDANFDGVLDEGEPTAITAADGSFALQIDDAFDLNSDGQVDNTEGRWVLQGGTDITTELPWKAQLTAPVGMYAITPLTTLVEHLVREQSMTLSNAVLRALAAFGITDYNLTQGNSLYEILAYDALSAQAYQVHVKLYSTVLEISELLAGKSGQSVDYFANLTFTALAEMVAPDGSTLDLTSDALIGGLIRSMLTRTGITLNEVIINNEAIINGAAQIIADAQRQVDAVQLQNFVDGQAFLLQINKVKKVLQGSLADSLRQVGNGTTTIISALQAFTGQALVNLISAQTATVTVPPAIGVDSVSLLEGNSGTSTLRFSVAITGDHDYPVSVSYQSVDATATAGTDYTSVGGTLNWPANDTSPKFIDVTIASDSILEEDESFKILLSNPVKLAIRQAEGTGIILNDETAVMTPITGASANDWLVARSTTQDLLVTQNTEERLSGPYVKPVAMTLQGTNDVPDNWNVDFSSNTYNADRFTISGGSGTADDSFSAMAGLFQVIEHTILGANQSRIRFVPTDGTGQSVVTAINTTNLDSIEKIRLSVTEVNTLIVRVPSSITALTIEDADGTSTGRMRIVSPSAAFAPIEFTNPTTKILILLDNLETVVTKENLDPGFTQGTGGIEEAKTGIYLSNNTINENSASGSVVGSIQSREFGFDGGTFAVAFVAGDGSNDNSRFQPAPNRDLVTDSSTVLDFETKNNYSIRVNATSFTTGESIEIPITIQVNNLPELAAPVQIGHIAGSNQRSIVRSLVLAFDGQVTIDTGAFVVHQRNLVSGNPVYTSVGTSFTPPVLSDGKWVTTVSFTPDQAALTTAAGNLVDGNYRLTIDATKVRIGGVQLDGDKNGTPGGNYVLGENAVDKFYAFYGDINGDELVDADDNGFFRQSYRKATGDSGYEAAFDFTGDGLVDADDLGAFRPNYRTLRKPF